jgi:hypothetical protein
MIMVQMHISAKDYRHALFVHQRPRRSLAICGILILVPVLLFIVCKLCSQSRWNDPGPLVAIGVLLYLSVYFFCFLPWQATQSFKQNRFLNDNATCVINDAGIHTQSELGNSDIPWDHFHRWKLSNRMILLYVTNTMYMIYPRHLFTDDAWSEFKGLARKNLNEPR